MKPRSTYQVAPVQKPLRTGLMPAFKCQGYLTRPPWRCPNNAHVVLDDRIRGRVDLCAECTAIAEEAPWFNVWVLEAA